jgi:ParB family chromosome partitioning protein
MSMEAQRKGLGALLQSTVNIQPAQPLSTSPTAIPISKVRPSASQPRTSFDETALQELADSIKARGLIQPIVVRQLKVGDDVSYEIIAGERVVDINDREHAKR